MSEAHGPGGNGAGNGDARKGPSHGAGNGAGNGGGMAARTAIVPANGRSSLLSPPGIFDVSPDDVHGDTESLSRGPVLSLAMLRRQLKVILIVALILMPILIPPVWLFSTPEYSSTAYVKVEPVAFMIAYKTEEQTIPQFDQFLNTQVTVVRSPKVLERTLEQRELKSTHWYNEKPSWNPLGEAPTLLERFRGILTITPVPRTQLIQIMATTRVPQDAVTIVNTLTDQYLKLNEESVSAADRTRVDALEAQLAELVAKVKSLNGDRGRISTQLGTDQPGELRTKYKMRDQELRTKLSDLELAEKSCKRELQKLEENGPASQPSSEPATSSQPAKKKRSYNVDPEWRKLKAGLQQAEFDVKEGQTKYGDGHWKMRELRDGLEHAQRLLKSRESELDETPIDTPVVDENGKVRPILKDRSYYERELERIHAEQVDLRITEKDAAEQVTLASKLANELSDSDEQLKQAKTTQDYIEQRLNALQVEGKAPSRITIASPGSLEKQPAKDRRILMTFAMIALSISAGLGVGYVRGTADPAIHEVRDLSTSLRAPFLGQLPYAPDAAQVPLDSLIGRMLQESVRMVRTAMMQRMRDRQSWTVLVTSPAPSAGKTTTAILLARSLAELGKKVLVIDADLRRRSLSRWFGAEQMPGLNAVLAGKAKDEAVAIQPEGHDFQFMPAGKGGGEKDAQLLANGSLAGALERWRKQYDFILMDSPPLLSVADARILANHADGVIMVLRASHSRRTDAMEAYASLSASGGTLLGSVLIGSIHSTSDYSRYGYYAATATDAERSESLLA